MQGGLITYGLLAALAIALLVAAVTDIQRRQIDNGLNAAIALAAPLFWLAAGLPLDAIAWQIGIAAATLAVCAGLFAINAMGGGDVKLLAALALWIQPYWFLNLIVIMALAGGVLTVALVAWHAARRHAGKPQIPYGIAISGAALWVLACHYLPTLQSGGLHG